MKILAKESFFTGGYNVRATIDSEMQPVAARALRTQLEIYDRARGIWRGTGAKLDLGQIEKLERSTF